MAAATAQERHAARTRIQRAPALPQRRISGPTHPPARPRAVPAPRQGTGVFERLRGLPDHRVIDRLLRGRVWICFVGVALMGIVAMQVSLLKLNSGIGRAVETTSTLERQNSSHGGRASRASPPASASAPPPTAAAWSRPPPATSTSCTCAPARTRPAPPAACARRARPRVS